MLMPVNRRWFYCLLAGLAASVSAQSLKIPDFRQPGSVPPARVTGPCDNCGEIRSIREINMRRDHTVPQAFRTDAQTSPLGNPNLVGAVVALPLGDERSEPFVGGVGTPEMRERFAETTYEITVRLDSGAYSRIERRDGGQFRVGDRVRLAQGTIERVEP
jgi:hypothetical protein